MRSNQIKAIENADQNETKYVQENNIFTQFPFVSNKLKQTGSNSWTRTHSRETMAFPLWKPGNVNSRKVLSVR